MKPKLATLLSIAGSDPTGGAGIQADIRVGARLGVHVMTAVTAVTVQNSKGLHHYGTISSEMLENQLNAILEDCIPDVVKIGMIGSLKNGHIIKDFLKKLPKHVPVVIDPIFSASSNGKIMIEKGDTGAWVNMYLKKLFPLVTVATPNFKELKILLDNDCLDGWDFKEVRKLLNLEFCIITGEINSENQIIDYLIGPHYTMPYIHPAIECQNMHGSGCTYSSLLACYLANNFNIIEAFKFANYHMGLIIENSCRYSFGSSDYGPLDINKFQL